MLCLKETKKINMFCSMLNSNKYFFRNLKIRKNTFSNRENNACAKNPIVNLKKLLACLGTLKLDFLFYLLLQNCEQNLIIVYKSFCSNNILQHQVIFLHRITLQHA